MNMPRPSMLWIYGLIGAFIIGWYVFGDVNDTPLPSDWTTVREMVEKGDVEKIQVVNRDQAQVFLKKEAAEQYRRDTVDKRFKRLPETGVQLTFTIGSVDSFREDLKNAEQQSGQTVPVVYENKANDWTNVLINLLPWVLIIGVWIFIMRSMSRGAGGGAGGGIMNVGKAKAQVFDKDASKRVTFKDVAGLEEAKVEIMEIVDFLKKSEKYKELGAKIPKGALLVGPPGTGKTLLAKAVAGEANVPFLSISGSDFVEMFVGVGASRVRDLFEQAKQKAPCIVFIDEIDAIGRARGKNAGFSGNDERENTLNQLLTEMDGFQTKTGVIDLAATNRADILDKALMRAGRFDRQIEVGLPDVKEREAIFNVHLRPLKLDPQLDREFLARQTPGFSGADIANVCNEAALIAARHNKKFVSKEDFLAAFDRIVGGLEKPNMPMTAAERRATAIHEAGHATVMWSLPQCDPVLKVTVVPRGRSLGATWYVPDERRIHVTNEALQERLDGLLGGRIAEEVSYGTLGAGALSDLERATETAYAMVAYYGMSKKIGPISYYDSSGTRDTFTKPFSEQTAHDIDTEVRRIIEEAYAKARGIIERKSEQINRMADLLLEKTTLFWGASYYLTDICLDDLPPMTLNAFRFIVAFVVLGLIFWKHVVHVNRITLRYSLIVGLALAGTYVAYNYGITRTSLSNAAFICALQVIFAPLLGFLFFRQRPGWKLGAALAVCTVGMALLTLNGQLRPASGDLICIITPLCYAADLLITEKAVRDPRVDPLGLGVCQLAVVGAVTLALALVLGEPIHLPSSGKTWAAALFLGVVCSGIAFVIQSVQQQYTTASHVGLIFTLEPVFASMVAFVMTGEVLSLRGYIGAALMLVSLFIMEGDWSFLRRKKHT